MMLVEACPADINKDCDRGEALRRLDEEKATVELNCEWLTLVFVD